MKMKEVLERTGLTDRAVRLYIANSLVDPECTRGYTGRNNYEFSESNVEILQKIALLRKADFSLEQIKALQEGGEAARAALAQYLEEKQEEYRRDGLILTALEGMPGEEQPDLDEICRRLTEGFREKQVPQSDLKPSLRERIEKGILLILSFFGMVFYGVSFLGIKLYYQENFLYPKFYGSVLHYLGHIVLMIPAFLFALAFYMQMRQSLDILKKRKRRQRSITFIGLAVLLTFTTYSTATMATMYIPMIYSETDNPAYYLKTDPYANNNYRIFPLNVPSNAIVQDQYRSSPDRFTPTTKYYYRYEDLIDPNEDVFAQWVLPPDEYEAEKERILTEFSDEIVYTRQWGDWICVSLTEADVDAVTSDYEYCIFAYQDATRTVRYIYAYCMDAGGSSVFPYFLELDWES